jgi:predicted nucleic acid-binding protein
VPAIPATSVADDRSRCRVPIGRHTSAVHVADSVAPGPDRRDQLRDLLALTHRRNATAPITVPLENGVFPPTFLREPRTLVADTRCLGADVGYAARNNQRTTLITAANTQALRLFCSRHVVAEVLEHRSIWSTAASAYIPDERFVARFHDEYLPLIRVVPDDGIPLSWLAPHERARVAILEAKDEDDIPSVKFALVSRSLYFSKDKDALRATYGAESDLVEHAEWLDNLRAGGDAAECLSLLNGTGMFGYLAGAGIVAGARSMYGVAGVASVPIGAALLYGAWCWLRHPSRASLRSGLGEFAEFLAEIGQHHYARQHQFDAALPDVPTWGELAPANPNDDVLGRASLYFLARERRGHLSAHELADQVRPHVSCSDAKIRAVLRATPCFYEVYRGRWQVGAVVAPG